MNKKVYIFHELEAEPQSKWFPWLKKKLETKGFRVEISHIPSLGRRKYIDWIDEMQAIFSVPHTSTHFVSKIPGCLTLIRYIEHLALHTKDKALLVSGVTNKEINELQLGSGTTQNKNALMILPQPVFKDDAVFTRLLVVYDSTLELEDKKILRLK